MWPILPPYFSNSQTLQCLYYRHPLYYIFSFLLHILFSEKAGEFINIFVFISLHLTLINVRTVKLFTVNNNYTFLISFQSSCIYEELKAFAIIRLQTSKPTGALQTYHENISNNQGHILQKR